MPFSTTYANSILNYLFSKTATLTAPAEVYIGLSKNDPEADGGTFNELSGGGYARVLISQKGETYPNVIGAASNRAIVNQYQVNWTKATLDWPEAHGFGLFSALTGGSPFFYGALEEPVTCVAGAVALFDPQTLKITFPASDTEEDEEDTGALLFAASALGTFAANETYGGLYTCTITAAPFTLELGKSYTVVWDGASYTCVAQDMSVMGEGVIGMGELSSSGGSGNGEPFAIGWAADGAAFMATDTKTTHSVAIYEGV